MNETEPPKIYNIKLKTGEDLLCFITNVTENTINITYPILMDVDRYYNAIFCKKYLLFSCLNSCELNLTNIIYVHIASDEASANYVSFLKGSATESNLSNNISPTKYIH